MDTYAWPVITALAFIAVAVVSLVWNHNKRIEREEAEQRARDLAEILARKDKGDITRP